MVFMKSENWSVNDIPEVDVKIFHFSLVQFSS